MENKAIEKMNRRARKLDKPKEEMVPVESYSTFRYSMPCYSLANFGGGAYQAVNCEPIDELP